MISEDRTLKVHVDAVGKVWYLDGDRLPVYSGQTIVDFPHSALCREAEKIRVLGCSGNARLLVSLCGIKWDGHLRSLEVASPMACRIPSHLRTRPEQALLDMRRWSDSPSRGGWHEFTADDYPSYAIAAAAEGGDITQVIPGFLREHPAWNAVSLIPHLNLDAVARLIGEILDPRFFVDRDAPDRLSKLEAYLGLDLSTSSKRNSRKFVRRRLVLDCWKGEEPGLAELKSESYFLWRRRNKYSDVRRGELRASQMWVAFLRHTWLDALYRSGHRGESLFVPEYFLASAEAMWFRDAMARVSR